MGSDFCLPLGSSNTLGMCVSLHNKNYKEWSKMKATDAMKTKSECKNQGGSGSGTSTDGSQTGGSSDQTTVKEGGDVSKVTTLKTGVCGGKQPPIGSCCVATDLTDSLSRSSGRLQGLRQRSSMRCWLLLRRPLITTNTQGTRRRQMGRLPTESEYFTPSTKREPKQHYIAGQHYRRSSSKDRRWSDSQFLGRSVLGDLWCATGCGADV